jgi:hypothetical protein
MATDLYGGRQLRPTQKRVMDATERFICVVGNRFPGKTTAALWKMMRFSIRNPSVETFIGRWHKKKLFTTTVALWRELFPMPEWEAAYKFQPEGSIEPDYIRFSNGSLIHLLPLQHYNEVLRGGNFSAGLIDQMEECPKDVWTQAVASVRGPVWLRRETFPYHFVTDAHGNRQNLSEERRFVIATVNKSPDWFWIRQIFLEHKSIEPRDIHRYALLENKWDENKEAVESGYYRDLSANISSESQRAFEVYGEDPSHFGLVCPDFSTHTHLKPFEFQDLGHISYWIGYDEGFDAPSSFLFVAIKEDGSIWVRREVYAARKKIWEHQAALREAAQEIRFPLHRDSAHFVADSAIQGKRDGNGVSIAEQWGRQWPWLPGTKDVAGTLDKLRTLMSPHDGNTRLFIHPQDCPFLVEQLQDATYDPDRPGKILRRCVVHSIDALRYIIGAHSAPHKLTQKNNHEGLWHFDTRLKITRLAPPNRSWLAPSRPQQHLFVPPHQQDTDSHLT